MFNWLKLPLSYIIKYRWKCLDSHSEELYLISNNIISILAWTTLNSVHVKKGDILHVPKFFIIKNTTIYMYMSWLLPLCQDTILMKLLSIWIDLHDCEFFKKLKGFVKLQLFEKLTHANEFEIELEIITHTHTNFLEQGANSTNWIIKCCIIITFLASTRDGYFSIGRTLFFIKIYLVWIKHVSAVTIC